MNACSLSTMWAQQERFEDMHDFVRAVSALGYELIEVSHSTPEGHFERLIDGSGARLSSIHAPAPRVRMEGRFGKYNSHLNLASLDDEERRLAIDHTTRSIDHAAQAGARFVVVHLGGVGNEMFAPERQMRRLFDSGTKDGPVMEALRRQTWEERAERAPAHFDRARETLHELVAYASARGVAIGLENRLHHHEIPLAREALELLADYSNDAAGYWHDVGHAEVQARLGYVDKRAWLDTLRERTIGAHVHDVEGIGDHRAPGHGDVEWDYIAEGLPPSALRVLEINQHEPDEAVARAPEFLRERGVV
jgi:sugar phosphate isomerase/epimerase